MESTIDKKNDGGVKPHGKEITIIINGTSYEVEKEEISFDELVKLAGLPTGSNVSYTITFRKGHGNKPEGTLVEGESVKLKEKMIFNVTATDRS